MRIPVIQGRIERRILANYRADPQVVHRLLPSPFRPKLAHGYAIAGICLIRLSGIHPRFWPARFGLGSENAAHRIAVEWEDESGPREGVYVHRRDSSSRLNSLLGGRVFPGMHHHARFDVAEVDDRFSVALRSDDGAVQVSIQSKVAEGWPAGSVFGSLAEASSFFEPGSVGYSPARQSGRLDGMELRCQGWRVEALAVESVESSFFDDVALFPPGSVQFDCALLMRGIEHEWHGRESICCSSPRLSASAVQPRPTHF